MRLDENAMKNRSFLILGLAILSLAIVGCPSPEKGAEGGNAHDILIGEYGSLTGTTATFGQSTHNGIMMAVDEVNAAGGIKGRKVKVLTEDDQSKPEEAANAVTKLISQNNVIAMLGEVASSRSLAAAPICQSNKVPMVSPASTNPKVTEIGDYIFRVCYTDPYQGAALGRFVGEQLKLKRAAILTDVKNDYSVGLAQYFTEAYTKLGGQIVAQQSYSEGDSDFHAQLTSIKATNPDVIIIPGYYTEIGQIAKQAREDLGMKMPMVGGDGWESPKLVEIGGAALNGCYFSTHYFADDPNPAVRNFVQKYEQRFGGKPDAMAALGYDAMKILAAAMEKADKIEGPAIRDALAKTSNFVGVTGSITLGSDRNAIKPLVIVGIENGQLVLNSTVPPAGTPALASAATTTAPATAAK